MVKIGKNALRKAIKKAAKLTMDEKESIVDEINVAQPNLLASVLVVGSKYYFLRKPLVRLCSGLNI